MMLKGAIERAASTAAARSVRGAAPALTTQRCVDAVRYGDIPLPAMRVEYDVPPHNGITYEECSHLRHKYLSPSLATFTGA